jgi:putative cofactor-binding repeat protein
MIIQKVPASMIEGNNLSVVGLTLSANANIAGATITSLAYNTIIPSTNYATLESAVAAATLQGNTILVCSNIACTTNTTVPSTVPLHFVSQGKITIDTGVVLQVNGAIQAYGTQIFTGDGLVQFASVGKIEYVRPQWWGAAADGVTEDTTAFKKAVNTAMAVYASTGNYVLKTVPIYNSTRIYGDGDTTRFTLYPNYDQDNISWGNVDAAMFDIKAANAHVQFDQILFDGNEVNQTAAVTPSLALIRVYQLTGPNTESLSVSVEHCTFLNQTDSSIRFACMDRTNQRQVLTVKNCRFFDGRAGIGSDDPASSSVNGFAPFYINMFDHGKLICLDNQFVYRKVLANTGAYAPGGIRWTWLNDANLDDGASGMVSGNYFYRLGRKNQMWDASAETGNNGLGVTDFYSRGRLIVIHGNTYESCFNSAVRGKVNCDEVTIIGNVMANTPQAINIGPNSTVPAVNRGFITIHGNVVKNTNEFGISVVGNSNVNANLAFAVSIVGNVVENVDNVHGELGGNIGGILGRYIADVSISGNAIRNAHGKLASGIKLRQCNRVIVKGNQVTTANDFGIYAEACYQNVTIESNSIREVTAGEGIWCSSFVGSTTPVTTVFNIQGNIVDTTIDYGIVHNSAGYINCIGNVVANVGGVGRPYYFVANSKGLIAGNIIGPGTMGTSLWSTEDGLHSQNGNSWNPSITYQSAAPTTGTWRKGDITWDNSPAANTTMGWVCVTAGTPGTWKSFATVAV